jgi:hypothetical protein
MFEVYLRILTLDSLFPPTKKASKAYNAWITALMGCNMQEDGNQGWEVEMAEAKAEEGYSNDAKEEHMRLMQTPHNPVQDFHTMLPKTFQQ